MSKTDINENNDSDISECESETSSIEQIEEVEVKPTRKQKIINPLEKKKPKKELSEKMKKVLADARKKGRETRRANKEMREEEKRLKEESRVLRRLEIEAKKNEIEQYRLYGLIFQSVAKESIEFMQIELQFRKKEWKEKKTTLSRNIKILFR